MDCLSRHFQSFAQFRWGHLLIRVQIILFAPSVRIHCHDDRSDRQKPPFHRKKRLPIFSMVHHGSDETEAPSPWIRRCVALPQFWPTNEKTEHLGILLEYPANPEKQFSDFLCSPAEFWKIIEPVESVPLRVRTT